MHECTNRARDPFTDTALITLIHWVRRVPSVAPALLTWLQQGHWHHQELAARLLISGIAGQAQHLDSACQAIERRVVMLEEGGPTWLLAALARQHPAAVDALNRISANPMVPTWARAAALAAAVKIRGLNAEEAATALRGLLDERRAGAGWSQVIAAAALLELGEEFRAEAIQILRDILADPYTYPNAKENAATALCGCGPDLRAEALAALRAIIADPLADCHDRRFAARGLATAGFPAEAASALKTGPVDRYVPDGARLGPASRGSDRYAACRLYGTGVSPGPPRPLRRLRPGAARLSRMVRQRRQRRLRVHLRWSAVTTSMPTPRQRHCRSCWA